MKLIDTHAHLSMDRFDEDRDEVIRSAAASGVAAIIDVGTDIESSRQAAGLADAHEQIFASAGIHPHEVSKADTGDLTSLRTLLSQERVVALGEIGLDYYYDFSPRELQRAWFRDQLELAEKHGFFLD